MPLRRRLLQPRVTQRCLVALALTVFAGARPAPAMTCDDIAGRLADQNARVLIAATGMRWCAEHYMADEKALASRTKAEWLRLCAADRKAYIALAESRRKVVHYCALRGSGGGGR